MPKHGNRKVPVAEKADQTGRASDQRQFVTMTKEAFNAWLDYEVDDYAGELVDGKRQGHGTARWPDGKQYVGQWQNDLRHGQGIVTWLGGQKYVGEWREDLATGLAILSKPDGSSYAGEFVDSQRQGLGVQTYPNGGKYTGEWKNDCPGGWGFILESDGTQSVGRFEINRRHGRGVQFFVNGENDDNDRIYWEEGELISQYEWFAREDAKRFEAENRRMGIPFADGSALSRGERIYLLEMLGGDRWMLKVPGMGDLMARNPVWRMPPDFVAESGIFESESFSQVLSLDAQGIAELCRQKTLSPADSETLTRWAAWSKSVEREAIETYIRAGLPLQKTRET
jgi:hypothetical protein